MWGADADFALDVGVVDVAADTLVVLVECVTGPLVADEHAARASAPATTPASAAMRRRARSPTRVVRETDPGEDPPTRLTARCPARVQGRTEKPQV